MPFRLRFHKVIMARHSCFIKGNLIFIQIWPWMSMTWCAGLSGPFSMHGVKTNWHFALRLHWFAKLLAWNTKVYPVLFPKRGWHFCRGSAFSFAPEEQRTGGFFQFADTIVLVLYFSAVKIVCWWIFMLTKWNVNWSVLKRQIILFGFCYYQGIEPNVALGTIMSLNVTTDQSYERLTFTIKSL